MSPNVAVRKKSLLAAALAAGATVTQAAEQFGISRRTVQRYLAQSAFRRQVARLRNELVSAALGRLADHMTRAADTVARLVDHLEHVAEVAGTGAVGLGPDFLDQVFAELHPGVTELWVEGVDAKAYVPGLEGPAGLPLLTEELVRRGWSEPDVRAVLGGNDVRLLRAELGVPLAARG